MPTTSKAGMLYKPRLALHVLVCTDAAPYLVMPGAAQGPMKIRKGSNDSGPTSLGVVPNDSSRTSDLMNMFPTISKGIEVISLVRSLLDCRFGSLYGPATESHLALG